jgi:phosphate starvation-inducible PhoH-like protein
LRKKKNNKPKVFDATENLVDSKVDSTFKNRLKPRTENQRQYIRNILDNTITFCQGLPGSGKTHIAVGTALEHLLDSKVKKIIITRPVVEAGEKIGYLPGDANSKLFPYLLPIEDEINYFISPSYNAYLKLNNKIEIVPLGYMRGRNFHNCFIVADECQNASYEQLKMLITRIGNNSKMVLTGDVEQSDLSVHMRGGFLHMMNTLSNIDGIGISRLAAVDIVRNPIIAKIIEKLEIHENNSNGKSRS